MSSAQFIYAVMTYVGYFLIMLIFMLIAVINAKRKTAWIFYVIGAVIQLLSLLGNQKPATFNEGDMALKWNIYSCLLLGFAILINDRYKRNLRSEETEENPCESNCTERPTYENIEHEVQIPKVLYCRKCGEKLLENSQCCEKCGTEIIMKVEKISNAL